MKIANGMEFINDEDVIGKWHLIGWSNKADHDSIYDLNERNNGYSELYFLPDGQPYWIFEGWTKGFLLIHHGGDAPILTYTYKTSTVKGKKYLFFHKGEITEVFVKVDNQIYDKATLGRHDKVNLPFVNDENVIGKWDSVGYVERPEDFNPAESDQIEYYLKSIEFEHEGKLLQNYMDETWNEKWTKGLILCMHRTTAAPYMIKRINDSDYLFMEWRMGDYIYGGCAPDYYVFKRRSS